jgi:hypothetical protein
VKGKNALKLQGGGGISFEEYTYLIIFQSMGFKDYCLNERVSIETGFGYLSAAIER